MKLSSSLLWSLKFFQNQKESAGARIDPHSDQINLQMQKPSKKGLPLTLWPLRVTSI